MSNAILDIIYLEIARYFVKQLDTSISIKDSAVFRNNINRDSCIYHETKNWISFITIINEDNINISSRPRRLTASAYIPDTQIPIANPQLIPKIIQCLTQIQDATPQQRIEP